MSRKSRTVLLLAAMALSPLAAMPISTAQAGAGHDTQSAHPERHSGEGEVIKIDEAKRRVELKHGPIQSLGWPAMRMWFGVTDAKVLKQVQPGDQVKFTLVKSEGKLKISEIKPR